MVKRPQIILSPAAATAVSAVALLLTTLAVGSVSAQQDNTPVVDGLHPDSLAALIAAAEEGDAAAQVNLGGLYRYGLGVAEDDAEAVRWYRAAAEVGDAAAQFNLGDLYRHGEGVPEDDSEAARWYLAAAEQGNDLAKDRLLTLYAFREAVPENKTEADRLYQVVIELSNAVEGGFRLFLIGQMYDNGEGVPENDAEAVRWYRAAAERGHERAQFNPLYDFGEGVPENDAERRRRRLSAANRANVRQRGGGSGERRRSRPLVPLRRRTGRSGRSVQPRGHVRERRGGSRERCACLRMDQSGRCAGPRASPRSQGSTVTSDDPRASGTGSRIEQHRAFADDKPAADAVIFPPRRGGTPDGVDAPVDWQAHVEVEPKGAANER